MNYSYIDESKPVESILGLTLSIKNGFTKKYDNYTISKVENNKIYISGNYIKYYDWNYIPYIANPYYEKLDPYIEDNGKILDYINNNFKFYRYGNQTLCISLV